MKVSSHRLSQALAVQTLKTRLLCGGKLNRLPAETRNALQPRACLGNGADFAMLRMVNQDSEEEMHGQLWETVRAGSSFVQRFLWVPPRPCPGSRLFVDRAQSRAEAHLRI